MRSFLTVKIKVANIMTYETQLGSTANASNEDDHHWTTTQDPGRQLKSHYNCDRKQHNCIHQNKWSVSIS